MSFIKGALSVPLGLGLLFACGDGDGGGASVAAESIDSVSAAPNNILLIIADDVGVDQLGLYGLNADAAATPNLDALAAGGQIYENAWSNPLCSPTRASIYTGRYAFRHGVGQAIAASTDPELQTSEVTLPEMITPVGYFSALAGKWHLGDAGTDQSSTTDDCRAPVAQGWNRFAGGLEGAVSSHYSWPKCQAGSSATTTTYTAVDNVDEALASITAAGSSPWMVTLAFNLAHTPWQIPPSGHYSDAGSCPLNRRPSIANRDCYRAMIEAMDFELGRLFAELDLTNTTVIFIGDNGTPGQAVAPGTFPATRAKASVYQGGVSVPLIVHSPLITATGRVQGLVHAVDLFQTVREITGATAPSGRAIDGVSLVPYFTAPTRTSLRATVYTEVFDGADDCSANEARAIRDARFKLVRLSCTTDELYDLAADPFESRNLLSGTLTELQRRRYEALSAAMNSLVGS